MRGHEGISGINASREVVNHDNLITGTAKLSKRSWGSQGFSMSFSVVTCSEECIYK